MTCRAFNLLSALSLVLGIATLDMWVKSYSEPDHWYLYRTTTHEWTLDSNLGVVTARCHAVGSRAINIFHQIGPTTINYIHMDCFPRRPPSILGLGLDTEDPAIQVPYWLMLLATAIMPMIWLRRTVRIRTARFRALRGLCLTCGYDLRASTERCPECGRPIPSLLSATDGNGPQKSPKGRVGE